MEKMKGNGKLQITEAVSAFVCFANHLVFSLVQSLEFFSVSMSVALEIFLLIGIFPFPLT